MSDTPNAYGRAPEHAPEPASEHAPELDVTHARQARRGRHAFIILICSTALVVLAFAALYTMYYRG